MNVKAKTVAVIELGDYFQLGSQHTSAMFAQRELGGQPLVMRMAKRLSACRNVDHVAIVGSNLPINLLTSGLAGVDTINMPSCHASERLGAAADRCGADWVVYVPICRPFVDTTFIDELLSQVDQNSSCDYIGFGSESGDLSVNETLGLFGEVCHVDALRRIRRNPVTLAQDADSAELGSLIRWLQRADGAFHLQLVSMPEQLQCADLKFSLEGEDDWHRAELLSDSIDMDDFDWQQIARAVQKDARLQAATERLSPKIA